MPSSSVLEPTLRTAPQWSLPPRRRLADRPALSLLVILAAQLMVVLDATIVNVALPHIQVALGFTSTSLSWVLNAYVLTFGGLLLLGARSGDLLGRRRIFVTGIVVFALASLAGGFAQTGWMLLGARALQGIGGALAAPSALALLTTLFPEGAARIRAIALFTTVSAAGGAIGLVAGGMLTEWLDWRWVMFVNVPIGLLVSLLSRKVIAETPIRHGRFDAVGALTSTLGMTGLVLGLVQAGSDGWASPVAIGSLAGGTVLLGVFVATERHAAEPVLPLRLITHPTRSAANAARGLVYSGMYGMFFFLSQFLQEVQHYSPLQSGVSFLPMPASIFATSQLTSRVLVRRLAPKQLMLLGIAVATGGLAIASQLTASSSYLEVLAALLALGGGSGISFVSLTTASLAGVAPEDAGAASGLINVSQQLGGALGVAVLVAVFAAATNHLTIGAHLDPAAVATLTHGLHAAFAVGVLFALIGFGVVAAFVRASDRRTPTAVLEEELAELEALDAAM